MFKLIKAITLAVFATVSFQQQSSAANIDVGFTRDNQPYIILSGELVEGDGAQFDYTVTSWKRKNNLINMLVLNSPGGSVYESYGILQSVIKNNINTVVLDGQTCASACVAIFAAGTYRTLYPNSRVGVHRVSVSGNDTDTAKAASVEMIEVYKSLNIPDSIRLKMIETEPSNMYFLTRAEKESFSTSSPNYAGVRSTVEHSTVPIYVKKETPNARKQARELNAEGITYIRNNNIQYAITVLEQARSLTPADAEILGNLGYAYYLNHQYGEAQVTLTASLNLRPKRGSSWNNLGLVLSAIGQEDWAVDCFIKYWNFSKNKKAATNQFFYWEEKRPGTVLDRASKRARSELGLYYREY